MTPKRKIFEIFFENLRWDIGSRIVAKFGENRRWEVAEKSSGFANQKMAVQTCLSPPPPFHPHWADHAQNFLSVVTPLPVHVY